MVLPARIRKHDANERLGLQHCAGAVRAAVVQRDHRVRERAHRCEPARQVPLAVTHRQQAGQQGTVGGEQVAGSGQLRVGDQSRQVSGPCRPGRGLFRRVVQAAEVGGVAPLRVRFLVLAQPRRQAGPVRRREVAHADGGGQPRGSRDGRRNGVEVQPVRLQLQAR